MADRIEHFDVTATANTVLPSYVVEAVTFPPGTITGIDVHIPGGHKGQTGLRVYYGSTTVIPRSENTWLKGNKKTFRFELEDPFPGGAGWFVAWYNAGKYAHTFQLTLHLADVIVALIELPPVLLLRSAGPLTLEGGEAVTVTPGSGGEGSISGPTQE